MITIPTPVKTANIRFENVIVDYSKNVRLVEKYDVEKLQEDISQTGLRNPLVVVDRGDKKYEVLQGFRRAMAISNIRTKTPDRFVEIPAVIYGRETTDAECTAIMLDHANVKSLGDFEMYLSVKKMLAAGYTEDEIGAAHGKSRGWAQDRRILARQPSFVEDEWRKKALGEKCANVTTKDIRALDTLNTSTGGTSASPSKEYIDAWGKITSAETKVKEPTSRTRKAILEQIQRTKNSEKIRQALRWAAGEEVGITDLDTKD